MSPADEKLSHDGPVIQNVQTTVNIVSGSSVEISQPEPCKVAGEMTLLFIHLTSLIKSCMQIIKTFLYRAKANCSGIEICC